MQGTGGIYTYNPVFYTGTAKQPDCLTVFVKSEGNLLLYNALPLKQLA